MEYVETNIGKIPYRDYLDILAIQYGYDSWEQFMESEEYCTD